MVYKHALVLWFCVLLVGYSSECAARDPIESAIGVTRAGTAIPCEIDPADLDFTSDQTRILLLAGADGAPASVDAAHNIAEWFRDSDEAAQLRERFSLTVVPCLNPDGYSDELGAFTRSGGDVTHGHLPEGAAYYDEMNPEAVYAWRWIGMQAPDLVIELRAGNENGWEIVDDASGQLEQLAERLETVTRIRRDDSLIAQLPNAAACDVGVIPAVRWRGNGVTALVAFQQLLSEVDQLNWQPSAAHLEIRRRLHREPREIVAELLDHYGRELNAVVYIEALAVIGRQHYLASTHGDEDHWLDPVEAIVSPYFNGERTPKLENGSDVSGHLVFVELARATTGGRQARYIELARKAADLAFDADGNLNDVMPFHNEMSDALFMGGPILAGVGALTGESRYYDACLAHLRFMRELDLRDDGLYRHSPLDESAWGRGNGFPAIGVALCLSDLPDNYPGRDHLLATFREHMVALAVHQDDSGCWHQVIDHFESYREFTATCMITFAMLRGVREGWLDAATFDPIIQRAWNAIKTRIGHDGELVDVCAGTGKQTSLRAYYDRPALLGQDPRGGAMALLVCNEMAEYIESQQ